MRLSYKVGLYSAAAEPEFSVGDIARRLGLAAGADGDRALEHEPKRGLEVVAPAESSPRTKPRVWKTNLFLAFRSIKGKAKFVYF